jgi:hypothetical protein
MTITEIARATRLSHPAIGRIIGTGKQQPAKQILNTTEQAILQVTHTTPASEGLTNATGTIRRIQALATIGYPLEQQAHLAGLNPDKPRHLLKQKYVHTDIAQAIAALFTHLQLTPNPKRSRAATRARTIAQTNGWLPPLAWDEDQIDNPNHHGHPQELAA